MQSRATERVFKALSDPTRRRILDALRGGPRTTGQLSRPFSTSRFAIMKHIGVLERAGLILVRRIGRERWNHLNAVPIQRVYERWVKPYEAHWARGLLQLQAHAERTNTQAPAKQGEPIVTEVSTKAEFGIARTELEISIDAPLDRVWKAITVDAGAWWPKDFYIGGAPKGYHVEPKLGGRVYEDWGDGNGLLWATVIGLDAPNWIHFVGYLAPPYAGPAINMLRLELKSVGRKTILQLSDTVSGKVDAAAQAHMRDGWITLYDKSMKTYVESMG